MSVSLTLLTFRLYVLYIAAASYTLFFKECFDRKFETEMSHGLYDRADDLMKLRAQSVHERMKNRPPAALPAAVPAAICSSTRLGAI